MLILSAKRISMKGSMQERITEFVTSHSKIDAKTFHDMMMKTDQIATDTGSIIDGYEAQKCGLIDCKMIPSAYQFVMVALFYKNHREPSHNQLKELVR